MLGPFQTTVCIVAAVILIIALIFVAIMLIAESNSDNFPPYSSSCPDYWNMVKSESGSDMCINDKSLGNVAHQGCGQLDPNNSIFSGSSGDCKKYNYARTCSVTWDGITNSEKLRKKC